MSAVAAAAANWLEFEDQTAAELAHANAPWNPVLMSDAEDGREPEREQEREPEITTDRKTNTKANDGTAGAAATEAEGTAGAFKDRAPLLPAAPMPSILTGFGAAELESSAEASGDGLVAAQRANAKKQRQLVMEKKLERLQNAAARKQNKQNKQ